MALEIIERSKRITEHWYEKEYHKKTKDGYNHNGWLGFDCDKDGNVFIDKLSPEGLANYNMVKDNEDYVSFVNLQTHTYVTNNIARCYCNTLIELHDEFYGSCQCPECGKWFNLAGQEVCPPDKQRRCFDW